MDRLLYWLSNHAVLIAALAVVIQGRVLELDERFKTAKDSGEWLVMFYAPWCGHCKQLEPIWMEVGNEMFKSSSSVHVARLDCTRFSSLSESFRVRGFPTIKYINSEIEYEYKGPRTKDDIISFANKAQGPAVSQIQRESLLEDLKSKHDVFYLYVGDENSDLSKSYIAVAKQLFISLEFYSISSTLMPQVTSAPTVLVFKDQKYYEMPFGSSVKKSELMYWVSSEQLPSFIELTGISYQKMKSAHKLFAIFVRPDDESGSLFSVGNKIALLRDPVLHPKFTFCWVTGNKIVNSLTYDTVPVGNVVVFDPETYVYYFLSDGQSNDQEGKLDEKSIIAFLNKVLDGKVPARGGSGALQQVKRFFSDAARMVVNLFQDSPILGSLVIGVPTLIISFLCYCLCTLDDSEVGASSDSEDDLSDDELQEQLDDELSQGDNIEPTGVRKRIQKNENDQNQPGKSESVDSKKND